VPSTTVQPSSNIPAIAGINALQPSAVEIRDAASLPGTPPPPPQQVTELIRNTASVKELESFTPSLGAAAGNSSGAAATTGANAAPTISLNAAALADTLAPTPLLSEVIPTLEAQQIRLSLMSKEELLPLPDQLPDNRVLSISLRVTYNLGIDGHTQCSDTRKFSILTRVLNADMQKNIHTVYKSQ
jgi:hypothetical protein